MIKKVIPVIDYSVRGLCAKSYPNHPKGCPNFNKRKECPPKAKLIDQIFRFRKNPYIAS